MKDIWDNALGIGAVPVIWGPSKTTVERLLPEKSYIFLENFVSAFEVTNYLEFLFSNEDAFSEYLSWREKPWNENFSPQALEYQLLNGFCRLCFVLHYQSFKKYQSISSLDQWWIKNDSQYCVTPQYPLNSSFELIKWWRQLLLVGISLNFPSVFSVNMIKVYHTIYLLFTFYCVIFLIKVTQAYKLIYSVLVRLKCFEFLPINRFYYRMRFQIVRSCFFKSVRSRF